MWKSGEEIQCYFQRCKPTYHRGSPQARPSRARNKALTPFGWVSDGCQHRQPRGLRKTADGARRDTRRGKTLPSFTVQGRLWLINLRTPGHAHTLPLFVLCKSRGGHTAVRRGNTIRGWSGAPRTKQVHTSVVRCLPDLPVCAVYLVSRRSSLSASIAKVRDHRSRVSVRSTDVNAMSL
jgi:hypothetical protein